MSAQKKSFTYEDLVNLIKSNNIHSIESLLPVLPISLRSRFTFFEDSLSLQKADSMHPRVIMFGSDGKLTCTFNGNPKLQGFDTIECYQFRDKTATFDFREIEFPSEENNLTSVIFSESNRRARGNVSCTSCHSTDPRPNWDSYDRWHGAYGEFDDSFALGGGILFGTEKTRDFSKNEILSQRTRFIEFKKTVPNSSRYKYLIFPTGDLSPYSNEEKSTNYKLRPNTVYTKLVSNLMVKRNVRILRNEMPKLKYGFLLGYAECNGASSKSALLPFISVFNWLPSFRELIADPLARDDFDFNTGVFNLNGYIARQLIEDLVNDNQLPENFLSAITDQSEISNSYQGEFNVHPIVWSHSLVPFCTDLQKLIAVP